MLTLNQLKCITKGGGPTSDAGKEISSRNAIKHGACATGTLILDDESHDDYLALEARWFQGYSINPASKEDTYQAELIRDAARADWFFRRSERKYAEAEAQMWNAVPDVLMWGNDHHNTLARYLRYRTTNANSVIRHRKAIEDYRKNRAAEAAKLLAAQLQEAKLAAIKTRLEITKQKNEPECSWAEHLENMRKKAIELGYTPPPDPNRK